MISGLSPGPPQCDGSHCPDHRNTGSHGKGKAKGTGHIGEKASNVWANELPNSEKHGNKTQSSRGQPRPDIVSCCGGNKVGITP
jgi:hypothetical protein